MVAKNPPPKDLGTAGKALWMSIAGSYELRPDELRTLEDACAASDMLSEFHKAWVDLGRPYMSTGSMGQEVEHPLIGSIDKQRKARQAFLRQLKLPDEGSTDVGGALSAKNRAAAQARWARRGA